MRMLALLLAFTPVTLRDSTLPADDLRGPRPVAVLDNGSVVPPGLSLSFTGSGSTGAAVGATLTVTRATTRTCANDSGLLETVAINTPCIRDSGVDVEPASTNVALQSQSFDNAAWSKSTGGASTSPVVTADTSVAPDGTTTADRVVTGAVVGGTDQSVLYTGTAFTATAAAWTASCYIKGTSGSGSIPMQFVTSAFSAAAGQSTVSYNPTTWTRVQTTGTLTAASWRFVIGYAQNGTAYQTGAGGAQDFQLWGCQVEAGAVATTYIATAGSAVARNADDARVTYAYSVTEGCIAARVKTRLPSGSTTYAIGLQGSIGLGMNGSNQATFTTTTGGTVVSNLSGSPQDRSVTLTARWTPTSRSVTGDGVTATSAAAYTLTSGTTLFLGARFASAFFLGGVITHVQADNVSSTRCTL